MRDAALQAAGGVLPWQEVDCEVDFHEEEPRSDPPIPVSASTTFFIASIIAQVAAQDTM